MFRVRITLAALGIGAVSLAGLNQASSASLNEEIRTLNSAYNYIVERHVNQPSQKFVVLKGLQSVLDKEENLQAVEQEGQILIQQDGQTIKTYTAPAYSNYNQWAELTAQVIEDLRPTVPSLKDIELDQLSSYVLPSLLSELDRFSRYKDKEAAEQARKDRNGFIGLGFHYQIEETAGAVLSEVFPHSPAEKKGLLPGDIITHIDGQPLTGAKKEQIRQYLKGDKGEDVLLRVQRDGASLDFTVPFEHVVPPTITTKMDGDIFIVRISSFTQSTSISLKKALFDMLNQRSSSPQGVILDLRRNPGGLLDQSVEAADVFLRDGMITEQKGHAQGATKEYKAAMGDFGESLPVVVLVDGYSASAAEILASALQANHRAVVVGTTSYGKGTVQSVIRLPNDGEMTLTWSRYYTPLGLSIHDLGVLPDVCTSGVSDDNEDPTLYNSHIRYMPQNEYRLQVSTAVIDEQKSLREYCPAEQRNGKAIDLKLAKQILKQPETFARIRQSQHSIARFE